MTADGVTVKAFRDDRPPQQTAVKADGGFAIAGLKAGIYAVLVEGPGLTAMRIGDVLVTPPETTRDQRLERIVLRAAPRHEP